jgi:uncharacterized protein
VTRGHSVTGASRSGEARADVIIPMVKADVTNADQVAEAASGHDAIVSAVGPLHGVDNDEETFVGAAHGLIEGARRAKVTRLIVVGGAGSLEASPGVRVVDTPEFSDAWKPNALAQASALAIYRGVTDLEWTYISPAAMIGPGERTGSYRFGGDQLLTDKDGSSRISYGDYAAGLVDELEQGNAKGKRITIAY